MLSAKAAEMVAIGAEEVTGGVRGSAGVPATEAGEELVAMQPDDECAK